MVCMPVHWDDCFFLGSLLCATDARFSGNYEVSESNGGQLKS